jgi:hypothetical protein
VLDGQPKTPAHAESPAEQWRVKRLEVAGRVRAPAIRGGDHLINRSIRGALKSLEGGLGRMYEVVLELD